MQKKLYMVLLCVCMLHNAYLGSISRVEAVKELELQEPVTEAALDQQVNKLKRQWHPDRFVDPQEKAKAEEKFKNLDFAYDFLKNDLKKQSQTSSESSSSQPPRSVPAYQTAEEALQNVLATHANVFALDKGVAPISLEAQNKWNNVLDRIDAYIKVQLDKPRSFGQGISASNRTLFKDAQKMITDSTKNIFKALEICPILTPQETASFQKCANIFANIASALKSTQEGLKPGLLDVKDTKDIKNLLSKIALVLEETAKKIDQKLKDKNK